MNPMGLVFGVGIFGGMYSIFYVMIAEYFSEAKREEIAKAKAMVEFELWIAHIKSPIL